MLNIYYLGKEGILLKAKAIHIMQKIYQTTITILDLKQVQAQTETDATTDSEVKLI